MSELKSNPLIIDIATGLGAFCALEWPKFAQDVERDSLAIKALQSPSFPGDRFSAIQDWLRSYRVFQGFTREQRTVVTNNLISFYDSKRRGRLSSPERMVVEFEQLEAALHKEANLITKKGAPRVIESLTSKALWCCYPFDVPIMDEFAEDALKVLARAAGITVPQKSTRFEQFSELWFKVYGLVQQQVIDFSVEHSTYPLRVFDRYLWWLGQTSYAGLISN